MKSLYAQLLYELERFDVAPHSIETLFIGGGTPSTISPKLYEPIFTLISPYLSKDAEITTEANPNSATALWLEGMKSLGVNRISFGVQSFDDKKLKALNRSHSSIQAIEAINNAQKIGFEHISLDLIYNYQGDTQTLLLYDIEKAFSLPIDHISAYELTIEEHTKFALTPEARQESETLAFFITNEIEKRGFKAYEISNFGTYQSRHNIGYWETKDYIGAGAGAVGFLKDRRFYPPSDIDSYISNPLNITQEILTKDELITEKIFLGLRSKIGISQDILTSSMIKQANILLENQKLTYIDNHYYNRDFFLSDELALFILRES